MILTGYFVWQHGHPSQQTIDRNSIAKLSFQLYAPSLLPSNWTLSITGANPVVSIDTSSGVLNRPASLNFFAMPVGDIVDGVQITEFKLTTTFNPPTNCGGLSQDTNAQGLSNDNVTCSLMANTNGQKIYWGTDPNNPITNNLLGTSGSGNAAYTVVGSTLLTIQVPTTVSRNTVVNLLESLKPVEASYFYKFTP